ncbi:hypothetical protein V6R98_28015, partial [Agrobacterium sp. CCNWLW71]|uniref:hypothetical protein n=1 Tax=unclassified Agrobacterium TaxID=2632611 RepID=UPI002FEEB5E9
MIVKHAFLLRPEKGFGCKICQSSFIQINRTLAIVKLRAIFLYRLTERRGTRVHAPSVIQGSNSNMSLAAKLKELR